MPRGGLWSGSFPAPARTLRELLDEAIRPLLRFDLDAPEFAALEDDDILEILAYQRIRRSEQGGFSDYYRDRADKDRSDNLSALPRYVPVRTE